MTKNRQGWRHRRHLCGEKIHDVENGGKTELGTVTGGVSSVPTSTHAIWQKGNHAKYRCICPSPAVKLTDMKHRCKQISYPQTTPPLAPLLPQLQSSLPYVMYHLYSCSSLFCTEDKGRRFLWDGIYLPEYQVFYMTKRHQQWHTVTLTPIYEYAL